MVIIGLYRVADIVMGVVANLFYSDKGYSINQIATFSKFWGLIATISGELFKNNIPANVFSGYFHDHIFIPIDKAKLALEIISSIRSS